MSTPHRHHFLPQFYTRQFTDADGKFYVYDVQKATLKNHGRKFSPSTHFYEHAGNMIYFGKIADNTVEKFLARLDTSSSQIFQKIKAQENQEKIDLEDNDWRNLMLYMNGLHWRNPVNAEKLKMLINDPHLLSGLYLTLLGKADRGDDNFKESRIVLDLINNDPNMRMMNKYLLPFLTYPHDVHDPGSTVKCLHMPYNGWQKIVGDNPIIYNSDSENPNPYLDDMLFPVTPNVLLVRDHSPGVAMQPGLRLMIDMLSVAQASKYVATTHAQYPERLLELFNKMYGSIDELKVSVFTSINIEVFNELQKKVTQKFSSSK